MSEIISYIVEQQVNLNTIYLLLVLPYIATIIAAFRQIIGIKSFGIYTPLVLTFAFWEAGLKYGLVIFIAVFVVGTLSRYVFKKVRLLYMPRMAMVLTVISLCILFIITLGSSLQKFGLAHTSILSILIMITLMEKFISAQSEKGFRSAALLSFETLLISVSCYFLVSWEVFREFVLNYPYVIFFLFIVNFFLGKWRGLRLSEYFRFKEVIKNVEDI